MTTLVPARRPAARARAIGVPGLLVVMTALTGLVDAVSYLGLGHVLVANMTGNVVFLGFALAGTPGFSVAAFVVALTGFLLGAVWGGRLAVMAHELRRWLTAAAGTQTVLTAGAAIATTAGLLSAAGSTRLVVITLLAAGLGTQNATVRRLAIPDLTTTVLTMTLTGLAADSSPAGGDNPRVGRRLTSAVAMLAGALAGATLLRTAGFSASLAVLAALYAAMTLGFAAQRPDGAE